MLIGRIKGRTLDKGKIEKKFLYEGKMYT